MEKKIKFGCVAWGLPGGGYFGPQIAKEAGLDGIQLELGSYEWLSVSSETGSGSVS